MSQRLDEADAWRAVLRVPRTGGDANGPRLPQDAIEIRLLRQVGPAMREVIELRNWSAEPYAGVVAIELDADFNDVSLGNPDGWRSSLTKTADGRPGWMVRLAAPSVGLDS